MNYALLVLATGLLVACKARVQQSTAPIASSDTTVRYLIGDRTDVKTTTSFGLMLMGGSKEVDPAFTWMLARAGGGDVVVLRASGTDAYNQYMFDLVKVNSVETLIIDSRQKALQPGVAKTIREAECLFIAGGDQWNYVKYWKNSPVQDAINYLLLEKKVPVGGTSAGLAILGSAYFSAEKGTVTSEQALTNPYDTLVTVGYKDFLSAPFMQHVITDSHYSQRSRHGRHVTWMARLMKDRNLRVVRGIGIDEQTAVCIDNNGTGKVFGINNAYFLSTTGGGPERCQEGQRLEWNNNGHAIEVYQVPGTAFGNVCIDVKTWTITTGERFNYYVENGALRKPVVSH